MRRWDCSGVPLDAVAEAMGKRPLCYNVRYIFSWRGTRSGTCTGAILFKYREYGMGSVQVRSIFLLPIQLIVTDVFFTLSQAFFLLAVFNNADRKDEYRDDPENDFNQQSVIQLQEPVHRHTGDQKIQSRPDECQESGVIRHGCSFNS